jgi:hypothetical protein
MKRKKPSKAPEVLPIEEGESRHVGVIYVQVGDVLVPSERMKRVPIDPKFVWTIKDSEGNDFTYDCTWETESKLPFGPVGIPADIDDAFNDNGSRIFEQWKGLYDLIRNGSSESEIEAVVGMARNVAINAVEIGFYLALLRYADHLKTSVEATAILEHRRQTAQKNGKARAKKAAPTHKAIQRRFRQLRKDSPKKTVRYLRIAGEYGMSDRQVARIVAGID